MRFWRENAFCDIQNTLRKGPLFGQIDDAQSDDDNDDPAEILGAILGHVGQREDVGYNNDRVDVSLCVDVGAVVGVGVNGQGASLSVGLGVGLVISKPPPPHSYRILGSLSEIWESYDFQNYHLSSWWGHSFNTYQKNTVVE